MYTLALVMRLLIELANINIFIYRNIILELDRDSGSPVFAGTVPDQRSADIIDTEIPLLVINIVQQAVQVALLLSAPMLLSGLIVGLVVSVFQAATSINEMTLSFIPKLVVTFVVMVVAGPWMLELMVDYMRRLFESIPSLIG